MNEGKKLNLNRETLQVLNVTEGVIASGVGEVLTTTLPLDTNPDNLRTMPGLTSHYVQCI